MKAAREMKIVTGGTKLRVERERGRRRKKGAVRSVWYVSVGGGRMRGEVQVTCRMYGRKQSLHLHHGAGDLG